MIQKLIYKFLILSALLYAYGNNQKTSHKKPQLSSNVEFVKEYEIVEKKSQEKENTAVMYKSSDLGATWSSFAKGIPNNATVSGIKQYGSKLYVATDYNGVFVSTDGQDNWVALNEEQLKGLDINCIEVEANNLIIGTLKQGIFVSKDGGLNWKTSEKNINSPIRAFIRFKNKLYAGTDSGIYESIDSGNSWSHNFGQLQILGFTILNEKIYAATQRGALMFDDTSANWKSIYDGDALHDIGNDGTYIFAMTIDKQLLKTRNDGSAWENAQNGIARPPNFYTNELKHIESTTFSAQWIGIYQSADNGSSWNKLNGLPDSTAFSTLEITDYGIIAGISIR